MPTKTETIANVRADEIGAPVGAYRVELFDDRGKVTERVDEANYLTPLALRKLQWEQARQFHRGLLYVHQGAATNAFPGSSRALAIPPILPVEFLIGLDSDVAANTASSWATGRAVAWGSRWKTQIPASSSRGQINETLSETSRTSSKIVFDFNTVQGNGVIKSLAIGRMSANGLEATYPASIVCSVGASFYTSNMPLTLLASQGNGSLAGFDEDLQEIYIWNGAQAQLKIRTLTYTVDAEGFANIAALTPVDVTLAGIQSSTATNGTGDFISDRNQAVGIIKVGTDWIMSYYDFTQGWHVGRWDASGAVIWKTTLAATGANQVDYGQALDLALIGSTLYLTASKGNFTAAGREQSIYTMNATTGAVGSTLPLGNNSVGTPLMSQGGICTNGTHLFVNTREGICKMTTAGAILEFYGNMKSTQYIETGLTPWPTTNGYQNIYRPSAPRDVESNYAHYFTGSARTNGLDVLPEVEILHGYEGLRMNAAGQMFALRKLTGNADQSVFSVDGNNCYSRAVLGAPVTKDNTKTMQLTYEVTFPTEWQAPPVQIAPPS